MLFPIAGELGHKLKVSKKLHTLRRVAFKISAVASELLDFFVCFKLLRKINNFRKKNIPNELM